MVGASNVPVDGPCILAANHTGLVDGPVVVGSSPRPVHMLVKDAMFTGLLGRFLLAVGQIPVDRDGGRAALTASMAVLRAGGVVGIFPEGNRGRGDAATARAGAAWLALTSGAPVVPVAVLGTRRTGEDVGTVPRPRRRLHVEFGAPLTIQRERGTSGKVALEAANLRIVEALSAIVNQAVARTGVPLPLDDPKRERLV